MFFKILLSSFAFFSLMNCQSQKLVKKSNARTSEITKDPATQVSNNELSQKNLIYLKEGENIFLKDQQMNITFNGITADSRCPEGVNCIWQGAATASITIMTTTSRPMQIELSTIADTSKTLVKTQNIAGYNITLEIVMPSPNQNNTTDLKGQYQIALKIEK
jgi:hypothetical protein